MLTLDLAAIDSFELIKQKMCETVKLYQPNFSKAFELTTDTSNYAIGAVLSQGKHPITFISRTLSATEQNYATNEKELLAIVWALQKLRNFLYGIADLTIYTDHQSLKYSISEKNPNSKLKRWKCLIEEFGAKIEYKPGSKNIIVDALSRAGNPADYINTSSLQCTGHAIAKTSKPVNNFRNQLHILHSNVNESLVSTVFPNYHVHKIRYTSIEKLLTCLTHTISQKNINAIHTTEVLE